MGKTPTQKESLRLPPPLSPPRQLPNPFATNYPTEIYPYPVHSHILSLRPHLLSSHVPVHPSRARSY